MNNAFIGIALEMTDLSLQANQPIIFKPEYNEDLGLIYTTAFSNRFFELCKCVK